MKGSLMFVRAAVYLRAALQYANVDLDGVEVVVRLKRPQDALSAAMDMGLGTTQFPIAKDPVRPILAAGISWRFEARP